MSVEKSNLLEAFCNNVCKKKKIRFCGIINSMGRIVAGSFRDDIQPLDNEQERQMLYMQSRLELSMKSEFNKSLGFVNYIITYRDNVVIINIPSDDQRYHILISAERISNIQEIINYIADLFKKYQDIPMTNKKIYHCNT